MSDPLARDRFQLHLSTALMLTICIGGLMWANLVPLRVVARSGYVLPVDASTTAMAYKRFGWPIWAISEVYEVRGESATWSSRETDIFALAIDVAIALYMLIMVWVFNEWRIGHTTNVRVAVGENHG